jgi:hypothetical protein
MFTTASTIIEEALCTADVADEAAVDLDLVEWETTKIAQRGIAGSKIVQSDPDSQVTQLMEDHHQLSRHL